MGTAQWLLGLWVAAALALGVTRGCLQCDPGFTTHFTTYKPRFSLWPWGLGGRSAVTKLLQTWPGDTLQELELRIPAEIRKRVARPRASAPTQPHCHRTRGLQCRKGVRETQASHQRKAHIFLQAKRS